MAYGLQIYDASSNLTLDSNWRLIRFSAFYSGTVTFGTPVTISVTGLTNDGTWGYNNSVEDAWDIKTTLNSGSITVTALVSGTQSYKILLFRI
jgi:hypothetical protein|tara:strand:- start:1105 stop:1383 length:279 start_codon:yes stop_codon:yes gene_type:complete